MIYTVTDITPGMAAPISDMARNDPEGFAAHVLSMLKATPND